MITSEKGHVNVDGTPADICADLACIAHALAKLYGKHIVAESVQIGLEAPDDDVSGQIG